jgi:hypothetical protein
MMLKEVDASRTESGIIRAKKAPVFPKPERRGRTRIRNQWYAVLSSREVRADAPVGVTQLPKKSELMMGENLVAGDAPIIEYRRRREAMKKEAETSAGKDTAAGGDTR